MNQQEPLLRNRNFSSNSDKLLMERIESSYSYSSILESNVKQGSEEASLEEIALQKLELFLNNLESRLDNFESYFKSSSSGASSSANGKKDSKDHNQQITSNNEYRKIYQTLKTIKNNFLDSSKKNLEFIINTLDENYDYLQSKKNLSYHDKALIFLQFFDYKFDQLDKLINNKDMTNLAELSMLDLKLNFFNFDTALKIGQAKYLHYFQLPLLWRENKYIVHGYRFSKNHTYTLNSICSCHNETSNIWTHLIGFFIMLYITLYHFPETISYTNADYSNLIIYSFLITSMQCLIFSVIWHTYSSFADFQVRSRYACIDYTGITVLISSSVITTEYAALYFLPKIRYIFIGFSALCGLMGLIFNWSPHFDKPESRGLRIGFFLFLAFLGCSAFFFMAYFTGFYHTLWFYSPLSRSLVWYLCGVLFYGNLIPEKWRYDVVIDEDDIEVCPQSNLLENENCCSSSSTNALINQQSKSVNILEKHFKAQPVYTEHKDKFWSLWWVDYIFNSHNIWHLFVLFGILGHYSAILEMFKNIPTNKF